MRTRADRYGRYIYRQRARRGSGRLYTPYLPNRSEVYRQEMHAYVPIVPPLPRDQA